MSTKHRTKAAAPTRAPAGGDWLMNGICIGSAAATFYGGYTVTVACGISPYVAWIWPVINDGLAYKAFRSVSHIDGWAGKAFAWMVTVLFAAQSGIAQGVDGVVGHDGAVALPWQIRAAVNGMPAAAALAAGVLHWLTTRPSKLAVPTSGSVAAPGQGGVALDTPASLPGQPATTADPGAEVAPGQEQADRPPAAPVHPKTSTGAKGPVPALTVVSGDRPDTRRPGVSAAVGHTGRTVVAAVPDTPAGHPADSLSGQRPDASDTPCPSAPDGAVRTGPPDTRHQVSGDDDPVSTALLSGLSVRATVRTVPGATKSRVETVRGELVAAGRLPAKGSA